LEKRIRSLDEANQQLTAQLAQAQQQTKLYKDRSDLMQRQLADVSGQLQSRVAASAIAAMPPPPVVKPPPAMVPEGREFGSNTSRRSGARLTANVSRELESDPLRDLGYEVEVASDGLRLRIPSDQLFQSGSSQLTPSGTGLLDRIAQILKTHYSDRRIAIEGYTDNSPIYGGAYTTSHQLTSAQAEAVLEQWIRRNQLPASQFVTLAHGSNHPISDNQNPAGRAANRRIEVVVQAEGAR
jgi:chemotaxis protein MotB